MFNQNRTSGAQTRAPLNLPKLSRLSSISNRKPTSFEIPAFPAASEIRRGICAACEKRIERDSDFLQNLKVCRKCVGIHSLVETAINSRAEEKHKASKLAEWSNKIKGGAK